MQGYLWIIWVKLAGALWIIGGKLGSSLIFYFVAIDDWRSTTNVSRNLYSSWAQGAPASNKIYYSCDVTLSVYPHRASLKNMPGHGGNRTYDLGNTSPMLCQLSYAVRTVRVSDISEQNLVPSIPM